MKRCLCIVCLLIAGCSTNTYKPDLSRFRQMEDAIGCIGTYNYNHLMRAPYKIGPIPQTRQEWQYWNMINSKLGKLKVR